jgi:hypothetical protein
MNLRVDWGLSLGAGVAGNARDVTDVSARLSPMSPHTCCPTLGAIAG